MSTFSPLEFQKVAIEKLTSAFLKLWEHPAPQRQLVFKSPTASGKTFMVSQFLHGLNSLPNWDFDKAFIWITFSDVLVMQSRDKFKEYLNTNLSNNLITVEDFTQGKLFKNDVLFVNWQKLVSNSADDRVLRRPDDETFHKEQGFYFEDVIENTQREGREIIMVVDESHTHLSELAQKRVVDVINPKIIINVSATPRYIPNGEELEEGQAALVTVKREDVIKEGLIKEKIVVQTDEDLRKYSGRDLDELLIDLAIKKKKELESEYHNIGKNINPLILIQLPNDDRKLQDAGQKTKEQVVIEYLIRKRVDVNNKVALWFDGKEQNMEFIKHNESDVDFMLFKQAAGTGWDCPRAHILIMFREITSATFYTQTIGRILRTAEPHKKDDYKNSSALRTAYVYTNYKRNEISIPDSSLTNKPFIYISKRIEGLSNLSNIYSDFVSRADYGDLGSSIEFQSNFLNSLDAFFNINNDDHLEIRRKKIADKGLDLSPRVTTQIIVDAEFSDYDKLNLSLRNEGNDKEYEVSRNDIEKLFNYWCYHILAEQTEKETKLTNIARSWSPLKSALRVWFKRSLEQDSDYYYRVFIADIGRNQSSVFRPAISRALKEYFPIKKNFLDKRKSEIEKQEAPLFEIKDTYQFTEDYEELGPPYSSSLSIIQPFYLRKSYNGRENELKFINYLETKSASLEWWFKNGEGSKDYFSLKYLNTSIDAEALFYPDWLLKFRDGRIGIFDTKSGFTAQNPEGRAEGLANKILYLNQLGGKFIGGLTVLENNQWYYFYNDEYSNNGNDFDYSYSPGQLSGRWRLLEDVF